MTPAADVLALSGLEPGSFTTEGVSFRRMPVWLELTVGRQAVAMALLRTVFVRSDRYDDVVSGGDPELVAHELTHVDQWITHGVVGFTVRYVRDYLALRSLGLSHRDAYRRIGFEWAAYDLSRHMVHRT